MKKDKMLGSLGVSSLIIILGAFITVSPLLTIYNMEFIYRLFFGIYAIIQLIQFAILYKKKDYTNFFSFLISIILLIVSFIYPLTSEPKTLALSLLVWVLVLSLVKLKKADYYNDRKSKVWLVEIGCLSMFFLSGILTCLSLANPVSTQIIVLGYFVLICGIIEVQESLLIYLTKGKLK